MFAYAKAGFGDYPGFLAAFGYWISSCIGNVSYWVLIKSTLGAFFPAFGDGNTVVAILAASAGIWLFHFLILRGTQQAAVINSIVTVAKIVPILVFLLIVAVVFRLDQFKFNLFGGDLTTSIFDRCAPPCSSPSSSFSASRGERVLALRAQNAPTSAERRSWASSS